MGEGRVGKEKVLGDVLVRWKRRKINLKEMKGDNILFLLMAFFSFFIQPKTPNSHFIYFYLFLI